MLSLSLNIELLFAFAAAFAFLFPLIKDGVFKQLTLKPLTEGLGAFIAVLVPFAALFGFAGFLGANIELTLPCFAGAAILAYGLSRVGLTAQLCGVLLLSASFVFTMFIPATADGGNLALSSAMLGLLLAKLTDSLLLNGDRALDDIIAPLSWLGGLLWLTSVEDQSGVAVQQAILLGIISVVLILRMVQRPFMTDDRWLLKRLILASTGGLGVLLVLTKLLLAMDKAPIAVLVGAGMLAIYLFQNIEPAPVKEEDSGYGTSAIKLLIVIGMLTLVATRFWGMFGLVALAPTALLAHRFSLSQFGGLYFIVRPLLQVFITNYNPNVTGINITHPYTGAAEYAGIIIMAALALLMRDIKDRRVLALVFFGSAAAVPMLSNYYMHAEPTSSLLVASAVGGVIFGVLGPAFGRTQQNNAAYEALLLMPAMMASVGITYSGLIDAGNAATNAYKTTILAYVIGAAVVCVLVGWFVTRKDKGTPLNGPQNPVTI